jgi:lipoprotein signal peptidase
MAERSYRKVFWGLAVTGLVLDQVTKYGVFRWLYQGNTVTVWPVIANVFDVRAEYREAEGGTGLLAALRTWSAPHLPGVNTGAVGGLDLGLGPAESNVAFAVISLAAALAIAWWASRPQVRHDGGLSVALGLILAGTLGNLYDRLVFGGVRDFLHFWIRDGDRSVFNWPVFNVADSCLVLGAFLLLAQAFFGKAAAAAPEPAPAAPQEMAEVR